MKRLIAIFLALLSLSACANNSTTEDTEATEVQETAAPQTVYSEEDRELFDRLIYDCARLLNFENIHYAAELSALDCILNYTQTKAAEDLIRARAATALVVSTYDVLAEQETMEQLTTEDYARLQELGLDVADLRFNYQTAFDAQALAEETLYWRGEAESLHYLAVDSLYIENLRELAGLKRDIIGVETEVLYCIYNYIALELPEEFRQALQTKCEENAAVVMASGTGFLDTTTKVIGRMTQLNERLAELLVKMKDATVNLTLNMSTFEPIAFDPAPKTFPLPELRDDYEISYTYYSVDEAGEVYLGDYADGEQALPDKLTIRHAGATLEDYQTYVIDLLQAAGYAHSGMTETAALFELDTDSVLVSYQENELVVAITGAGILGVPFGYVIE